MMMYSSIKIFHLIELHSKKNVTPRKILQYFGTEIVRTGFTEFLQDSNNFWVDKVKEHLHEDGSYVITDVRFKNEVEFIKDNGGVVILIKRPGFEPSNVHSSENGIEDYDIVIDNDGTIDDLKKKIELLNL